MFGADLPTPSLKGGGGGHCILSERKVSDGCFATFQQLKSFHSKNKFGRIKS